MPLEEHEFWKKREAELGLPILARNLAHLMEYPGQGNNPHWGLLYVTAKTLYFHMFPREGFMITLMRASGRRSRQDEETITEIPLSILRDVTINRREGWLARLFAEPETLVIRYDAVGGEGILRLQLEGDAAEMKRVIGAR